MVYQPRKVPFEHTMYFDRWTIWDNFLTLSFTYVHGTAPPSGIGLIGSVGRSYRFRAFAPEITAPIDFKSNAITRLPMQFALRSSQPSGATAHIDFDPDLAEVTWGALWSV
jgi:hypothetical protein